jgi:hypothetical protein
MADSGRFPAVICTRTPAVSACEDGIRRQASASVRSAVPLVVPTAPSDPAVGSTQSSFNGAVVTVNRGDAPPAGGGVGVVGGGAIVVVGAGRDDGGGVDGRQAAAVTASAARTTADTIPVRPRRVLARWFMSGLSAPGCRDL